MKLADILDGAQSVTHTLDATPAIKYEQDQYFEKLRIIDESDISVTKWEANFIESMLTDKPFLTTGRKETIDKMWREYGFV